MMFFPHNSMFAGYKEEKNVYTYFLKVNEQRLVFTNKMWWKKDLLENNATEYGRYLEWGKQTILGNFIDSKIKRRSLHKFFRQQLTAGNITPGQWSAFYSGFAGQKLKAGDKVALVKYELSFKTGNAVIIDSLTIFNFQQL